MQIANGKNSIRDIKNTSIFFNLTLVIKSCIHNSMTYSLFANDNLKKMFYETEY